MACLWLSPGQDANCHYLISLGKASFTAGLTLTFPGWTGPASGLEEGHRGHMDPWPTNQGGHAPRPMQGKPQTNGCKGTVFLELDLWSTTSQVGVGGCLQISQQGAGQPLPLASGWLALGTELGT